MLLRPALQRPDHRAWRADPSYSLGVAYALRRAFARITPEETAPDEFFWACGDVALWLNTPMAPRQLLRIFLLFARTHECEGSIPEALRYVDRALEVAGHHHAIDDFVDLLIYHAKLHRAQGQWEHAVGDLDAAYGLLLARANGIEAAIDLALRVEIFTLLADYEYCLAHFDASQHYLARAQQLVVTLPQSQLQAAWLAWTQAYLDDLRGLHHQALYLLERVTAVYAQNAPPISQGRLATFTAEVALAAAENLPDGLPVEKTALLRRARAAISTAEHLARQQHDRAGQGLAKLAHARYSRVRNTNANRLGHIEEVLRLARQLDDEALMAQAFTARGDELTHQGNLDSALSCYRQTLGVLDGSEVPVLAVPARRRLLQAAEMSGA